jgi:alpha-tubulin suppressor-like RCC1 family protein
MMLLRTIGARSAREGRAPATLALALLGCARDDWRFIARDAAAVTVDVGADVVDVAVGSDVTDAPDVTAVADAPDVTVAADVADAAADRPADAPLDLLCRPGSTLCGAECVDTSSSSTHCGGCNQLCGLGQTCSAGRCRGEAPGTCADAPCGGACTSGRCTPPDAIVVGGAHACARFVDGSMRCWGGNGAGQLGRGVETSSEPTPAPVVSLTTTALPLADVQTLSAGASHTCAAVEPGTTAGLSNVRCWGANALRQLAQPAGLALSARPAVVTEVVGASKLAAGGGHTCALTSMGTMATLLCWGNNASGQVGVGVPSAFVPSPMPVSTAMLPPTRPAFLGVAAGAEHTCAWSDSGVYCWGRNNHGALGRSTAMTVNGDAAPAPVPDALGTITKVVAGEGFTCALARGGRTAVNVWCWGYGEGGRTGLGDAADAPSPRAVTLVGEAVDLAAGRARLRAPRLRPGALLGEQRPRPARLRRPRRRHDPLAGLDDRPLRRHRRRRRHHLRARDGLGRGVLLGRQRQRPARRRGPADERDAAAGDILRAP